MIAPGALIRIPITLVGDADLAKFEMALDQLAAAEPQLEIKRTPTRQRVVLGGGSEWHLEMAIDRLIRYHGFEIQVGAPEVAYLETISRVVDQDYIHKRQSGGTGQFARIKVRFEPLPTGTGYKFQNDLIGGSVPADFALGVEKGLESARQTGPITGSPVTDFQATVLDGAYHEVDSSALTFEIAARACFKEGIAAAKPRLLEPIMRVEVVTPQDFFGSVTGNLASRRGSITGGEMRGNAQIIQAMVPLANMFGYVNQLRGMSQGRAQYTMHFDHYEPVPPPDPDYTHPGAAIGLRPA